MSKKFFICILLFFSNASLASVTEAETYTTNAIQRILYITTQEKEISVIRDELVAYIKSNVDINWTSKFVLGKHWRKASKSQKTKFTSLFEQYLIYNYAPKFQGYNDEKYELIETTEISPQKYISKIKLKLSNGTNIMLDVFILEKDSTYKIVDISGEGISFAATQRAEFSSVITTNGLDNFLTTLENKVNSLKQNYHTTQTTQ